ncbi:g5031 [Coccomyxa viridis]|uniref:G5031 protein n=1 Tax=Coccomyxa viridis TaxID=1274662 RepID=A0ABP1FUD2_9CHLO
MAQRHSWTGSHFGRASTVSLCEGRGRDKPAATSADELSPTSNDNVVKWRTYTNKAAELAKEEKYEDAERYLIAAFSEAIGAFGTEDPHTVAACQDLADLYRVMRKYDLAIPLYNKAVASLTKAYGLEDTRTMRAVHNLAAVVIPLMWGLAEACEEEGFLIEAENAYKGLSEMHDAFKDDPSIPVSNPLLFSDITLGFAQFLRRQGRLDKARELCDQVISDHRAKSHDGVCSGYWPAVQLLVDMEMEDGSKASLSSAVKCLQTFCEPLQDLLAEMTPEDPDDSESQSVWYRPQTWRGRSRQDDDSKVYRRAQRVLSLVAVLTKAWLYLAQVQSRLDQHAEAWATLSQALDAMQGPALAQALQTWDFERLTRLPKRFAEMKQDVQRQMAESYKAMCSPNGAAHGSKEQCAPMQKQLTAALAA